MFDCTLPTPDEFTEILRTNQIYDLDSAFELAFILGLNPARDMYRTLYVQLRGQGEFPSGCFYMTFTGERICVPHVNEGYEVPHGKATNSR